MASMITVNVELGDRAYPIHIGADLIGQTALFAPHIAGSSVTIVTNTTVDPLYGDTLRQALAPLGKQVSTVVLPDGEAHKNLETLNLIFDALLGARADRKTTLIALGGGVIGDMTGFAAASYMRGVPFIQVPTTLLSQVDSSVGGKTGINHPLGKNMIGAFYQPQAVIADIGALRTLPARELAAGIAEVIKTGAIADAGFFDWIEANVGALNRCEPQALAEAVKRSCEIKASVVAAGRARRRTARDPQFRPHVRPCDRSRSWLRRMAAWRGGGLRHGDGGGSVRAPRPSRRRRSQASGRRDQGRAFAHPCTGAWATRAMST